MNEPIGSYIQVREVFGAYWRDYGGGKALVRSPYLHAAVGLTVLLFPAWISRDWWTNVLQVLPNIVGFSIGGYAIWLGFGDEKFKALISFKDKQKDVSPYMEVSATFCHFVVVQLAAIAAALAGSALNVDGSQIPLVQWLAGFVGIEWRDMVPVLRALGGFIGFLLFMYALTTALAAVFAIFEVARWFDTYRSVTAIKDQAPKSQQSSSNGAPTQATISSQSSKTS